MSGERTGADRRALWGPAAPRQLGPGAGGDLAARSPQRASPPALRRRHPPPPPLPGPTRRLLPLPPAARPAVPSGRHGDAVGQQSGPLQQPAGDVCVPRAGTGRSDALPCPPRRHRRFRSSRPVQSPGSLHSAFTGRLNAFAYPCTRPPCPLQTTTTCCPSAGPTRGRSRATSGAAWARCCRCGPGVLLLLLLLLLGVAQLSDNAKRLLPQRGGSLLLIASQVAAAHMSRCTHLPRSLACLPAGQRADRQPAGPQVPHRHAQAHHLHPDAGRRGRARRSVVLCFRLDALPLAAPPPPPLLLLLLPVAAAVGWRWLSCCWVGSPHSAVLSQDRCASRSSPDSAGGGRCRVRAPPCCTAAAQPDLALLHPAGGTHQPQVEDFAESVIRHYWYEFFADDLPIWGFVGPPPEQVRRCVAAAASRRRRRRRR